MQGQPAERFLISFHEFVACNAFVQCRATKHVWHGRTTIRRSCVQLPSDMGMLAERTESIDLQDERRPASALLSTASVIARMQPCCAQSNMTAN